MRRISETNRSTQLKSYIDKKYLILEIGYSVWFALTDVLLYRLKTKKKICKLPEGILIKVLGFFSQWNFKRKISLRFPNLGIPGEFVSNLFLMCLVSKTLTNTAWKKTSNTALDQAFTQIKQIFQHNQNRKITKARNQNKSILPNDFQPEKHQSYQNSNTLKHNPPKHWKLQFIQQKFLISHSLFSFLFLFLSE